MHVTHSMVHIEQGYPCSNILRDFTGVQRNVVINPNGTSRGSKKKAVKLPDLYTNVLPLALLRQDPSISKVERPNKTDCQLIPQALQKECKYVNF